MSHSHNSLFAYGTRPMPIAPCVATAEGVQAHPPLQVMEAVTAAARFAPELHPHCVMYTLPASEVEELGHCLQG